jgi:hypothetical protein
MLSLMKTNNNSLKNHFLRHQIPKSLEKLFYGVGSGFSFSPQNLRVFLLSSSLPINKKILRVYNLFLIVEGFLCAIVHFFQNSSPSIRYNLLQSIRRTFWWLICGK